LDLSGLNPYLIGAGLVALLLLILMLRFALKPGKKKGEPQTGLGLPVQSGTGAAAHGVPSALDGDPGRVPSGAERIGGPGRHDGTRVPLADPSGQGVAFRTAASSHPSPDEYFPGVEAAAREAESGSAAGAAALGEAMALDGAPDPATAPGGGPALAAAPRRSHDVCPKCGGRFLEGEMEGPTLMVDGVAREDFQPLLSAKECSACGYLEFYTKPARG
jgi:hypothetical protein